MEIVWSKKIDEILKIGQPLDNVGVHNWALTKIQALNVIDQFLDYNVAILGGDVYENIDGIIQSNYDSWFCDPLPGETGDDFTQRSIKVARTYIGEYKLKGDKIFFVIVPSI
jgi:hypothetical protein